MAQEEHNHHPYPIPLTVVLATGACDVKAGLQPGSRETEAETVKPGTWAIGPGPGWQEVVACGSKEYGRRDPSSYQENEGSVI